MKIATGSVHRDARADPVQNCAVAAQLYACGILSRSQRRAGAAFAGGAEEAGLVVRGERPMPSVCQRAAIHRLEIPYGRFERRIALPPGSYRLHEQLLEDGFLIVVLRQPGQG